MNFSTTIDETRIQPLANAHPLIIIFFDWIYHRIIWIWTTIVLGSIIYGALASFITTGSFQLNDPRMWPSLRVLLTHPQASLSLAFLLIVLTTLGWLAHPHAHDIADDFLFTPINAKDLRLIDYKQGAHPIQTYFERPIFYRVCEILQKDVQIGHGGIILFGPPMVGKTRMALEAIRLVAPNYLLLSWPRSEVPLNALERFRGRNIILLLDDLHELARQSDSAQSAFAIQRLNNLAKKMIVVATSRPGSDADITFHAFGRLLETLQITSVDLEPITEESKEAISFLEFAGKEISSSSGQKIDSTTFDGTPGSVLLGLDRRTVQLRSPEFPQNAKAILKSLALLRAAHVYNYPESRIRRVSVAVFEVPDKEWPNAIEQLIRDEWIRSDHTNAQGESILRLPADAYLDVCLPQAVIYPRHGRRIPDDFSSLASVLSQTPIDSDALFSLSGALISDPLGNKGEQLELALQCVHVGLQILDENLDSKRWADAQLALGNVYWQRVWGKRGENLEQAIVAYEHALQKLSREVYPYEWGLARFNLANAYWYRIMGVREENIERAIQENELALQILTQKNYPVEWGKAMNNLGLAFRERTLGDRVDNLERAINAFVTCLQVRTLENYPEDWAQTQNNLGNTYVLRVKGERAKNIESALEAFKASLQIRTRDAIPVKWAEVHNNMGYAYTQRVIGEPIPNMNQAMSEYQDALQIRTKKAFPVDWAKTTYNLGVLQVQMASYAKTQGDLIGLKSHLEAAAKAFDEVLDIYTEGDFPDDHARVLEQLAYIEQINH